MENIKSIIADNITKLRTANSMTQLELAEKLNYSDKAVSKWERGESIPDVTVLLTIANMFGVTLDYLVNEHKVADTSALRISNKTKFKNHVFITGMSVLLVWLVATLLYVILALLPVETKGEWLPFLYAVPATMVVWLVFNSVWFNKHRNFLIISLLMWSCLAAFQLTFLAFSVELWLVYLLGIPGQIIILMWSKIKLKDTEKKSTCNE